MAELSVHMCEDSITFAHGGELLGKLKKTSVDPRGLEGFVKVNYSMQGTVAYQTFLQGVVAGFRRICEAATVPVLPSQAAS